MVHVYGSVDNETSSTSTSYTCSQQVYQLNTLNTTFIKDGAAAATPQSTATVMTYTMTPDPLVEADGNENYDLDDLCSDASTDDEDCPKKVCTVVNSLKILSFGLKRATDILPVCQKSINGEFF